MDRSKQLIVFMVLTALLEDKHVGEFWHTLSRKQQNSLKKRMEDAVTAATAPTNLTMEDASLTSLMKKSL
jgi:hypothetical protein